MRDLPHTWCTARLSEICERIVDGSHNPPKGVDSGFAMLSARNVNDHQIIFDEFRWISAADFATEHVRTQIKPDDVLLTIVGTIGRTAVVPKSVAPFALQRSVAVLRPSGVDSRYLAYLLESPVQQRWLTDNAKGTAQKGIYLKVLASAQVPLASAAEQTRIVDKLEELLSDLDAGVAELKAAQKKLAQYRQSLLKAAVEGRLTEAWRAQHGEPEESGAQLLARILRERRGRWEAKQLCKFERQGKAPPTGWQARYSEPMPAVATGLPELPKVWAWTTVEQIASDDEYSLAIGPFGSNLRVPDYRESGVPLVFVRNIRSSRYGGSFTKYVSQEKALELRAHSVKGGDVLVTKMGEPPGDADVYPMDQPFAVVTADCIKVSCRAAMMNAQFLAWTINSEIGRRQIRPMTQGVAQKKVSLGRFSQFAVPLAPTAEQHEVVNVTSMALEEADAKQRAIDHALRQSAAQRKNILQAAFSGRLVPQDPNDEPASVLLARIRAERAVSGATEVRRRRAAAASS